MYHYVDDALAAEVYDAREVTAFCAGSMTHIGVGCRRTAPWGRNGAVWFDRDDATGEGHVELRQTVGDEPFQRNRCLVATGSFEDLAARIVE